MSKYTVHVDFGEGGPPISITQVGEFDTEAEAMSLAEDYQKVNPHTKMVVMSHEQFGLSVKEIKENDDE
jgi:hypothetical protein